ncbi:MAG TPA: glycerophosphodiester phosphodiesterase [Paenibacillus sp.]|nr:glycerophosphodiester phosphodiesterase [Paenibacillus sp.]
MKVFIRHSARDVQRVWKQILVFESIYMAATGLLFVPALVFLFNRFLNAIGANLLLNADVYRLALTLEGGAVLAAAGFAAGMIMFLDFGTVIVIAQQRLFGRDTYISDAFATTARALPRLLGLGFIQWVLLLFTFSPWVDTPLAGLLLGSVNVPIVLVTHLYESKFLLFLYALALAAAAYLFLRCIFAMHYILIEGQTTARAIRSSFALTRGNMGALVAHLALLNAAIYAAAASAVYGASSLIERWESPLRFAVADWYVPVASLLALLFATLTVPINLVLLTRLFYVMRRAAGVPFENRLRLIRSRVLRHLEFALKRYFRTRSVRYGIALAALVYAAGALVLHQSYGDRLVYLDWHVKVIAHRGDVHAAPENTMSSVRAAIAQGADAVEIDVQLSKDGVVVLHHDYTLERVAGVPFPVHELTYPELLALEVKGAWTGMPTERIATLEEALQEAKGKTKLVVEIKPYGDADELARRTAELVAASGMASDVYVQSFDYGVLRTVKRELPELKVGQILYAAAGDVSSLDVDFYTISQTMLSERFIRRAHALDREVWVWTVNIERNMRETLTYDVDGVITDYPGKLRSLVGVE